MKLRLCRLQEWMRYARERAIIVLEGRTGAGRGEIIRSLTADMDPRVFRLGAMPRQPDGDGHGSPVWRYGPYFPSPGEIVIFSPSWHSRATNDYVLGHCSFREREGLLQTSSVAENYIVHTGTRLIKLWLEIGPETQTLRLQSRLGDPLKRWKVQAEELELYRRRYDVSKARDLMLEHTDTPFAPWNVVHMDNYWEGTLNALHHILSQFPDETVRRAKPRLPMLEEIHAYDEYAFLATRRMVDQRYRRTEK